MIKITKPARLLHCNESADCLKQLHNELCNGIHKNTENDMFALFDYCSIDLRCEVHQRNFLNTNKDFWQNHLEVSREVSYQKSFLRKLMKTNRDFESTLGRFFK